MATMYAWFSRSAALQHTGKQAAEITSTSTAADVERWYSNMSPEEVRLARQLLVTIY